MSQDFQYVDNVDYHFLQLLDSNFLLLTVHLHDQHLVFLFPCSNPCILEGTFLNLVFAVLLNVSTILLMFFLDFPIIFTLHLNDEAKEEVIKQGAIVSHHVKGINQVWCLINHFLPYPGTSFKKYTKSLTVTPLLIRNLRIFVKST